MPKTSAPGKGDMLPGKIGWAIIVRNRGCGECALADQPSHIVIHGKAPVPRVLGTLGKNIAASIIIEFDPSGKTEWANIIELSLTGKRHIIIHPVKPESSPYPTGRPSILKSMQGTIDIITRGIPQHGSMGLIKSPMGNQSKIQTRGGIGIVLIGTRNMLVPVEKSIKI